MTTKALIRKEIELKRRALDAVWVHDASQSIVERLCGLDPVRNAKNVALYKAIPGEVYLENLFSRLWSDNKHTCIPVFNRQKKRYEIAEIDGHTLFATGHYGIQEPVNPALVSMESIDVVIVPGVAFDPAGHRLGRGGGYYDRLLTDFKGTIIAVAFGFQLLADIPCDDHDIPVDYIVTEAKNMKVQNEH